MANQDIIIKQQVRGTSAQIAAYAGAQGQIVYGTDNKRLYVMSGTAGTNTQYLSTSEAATKTNVSKKLDARANAVSASKIATARKLQVALGSTTAVSFDGSKDVTNIPISGTLAISHGGTGLTASPSMLVNLASTAADNVLQTSPRPGVTGVLSVANGGTGRTDNKSAGLTNKRYLEGVGFDGTGDRTHFTTCATAASTAAKVVNLTDFKLVTGARVIVKFMVTNTASNCTLNVNGTGDKYIKYRGGNVHAAYLAANRVYEFVYDGTDYELIGDLDTNSTGYIARIGSRGALAGYQDLPTTTGTSVTITPKSNDHSCLDLNSATSATITVSNDNIDNKTCIKVVILKQASKLTTLNIKGAGDITVINYANSDNALPTLSGKALIRVVIHFVYTNTVIISVDQF